MAGLPPIFREVQRYTDRSRREHGLLPLRSVKINVFSFFLYLTDNRRALRDGANIISHRGVPCKRFKFLRTLVD